MRQILYRLKRVLQINVPFQILLFSAWLVQSDYKINTLSVRKDTNESRPEEATEKTVEKESLGNEVENNDKVNV